MEGMQPQAQGRSEPPAAGETEKTLSQSPQRGHSPAHLTQEFRPQNWEMNSCGSKPPCVRYSAPAAMGGEWHVCPF